eukprot:162402-Pyramimonas_sp.AAC.1
MVRFFCAALLEAMAAQLPYPKTSPPIHTRFLAKCRDRGLRQNLGYRPPRTPKPAHQRTYWAR